MPSFYTPFYKILHRLITGAILLLTVQQAVVPALPARADAAPPPPPVGSNLPPGSDITEVRMVSETVTMDISDDDYYPVGYAKVSAIFNALHKR